MYLVDKTVTDLLIGVVDCALRGSEYGIEAWELLRKRLQEGEPLELDDFANLEELLDRAQDDIQGPEFRIDLSQDRLYG